MARLIRRFSLPRVVAIALTTAGLAGLTGVTAIAAPQGANAAVSREESVQPRDNTNADASDDTKAVEYRGYRLDVPATWPVVDLAKNPKACVRFDKPAVFLGNPGPMASCPNHLIGRTTAVWIRPLVATTGNPADTGEGTIQLVVEKAGVLVDATYGNPAEERRAQAVLRTAKITANASPSTAKPNTAKPKAAPLAVAPQPGTYLGKGFDACTAPSQSAMNAWGSSPFRAVGVYISGPVRACGQANLTSTWVSTQVANGWHLIPIEVGPQAPCSSYSNKMSSDPATARSQGSQRATASMQAAQALGIPAGSALYNDMEGYTRGGTCTPAVMSFLSGWTDTLHQGGYLSGVYSSAGSGIADLAANYNNTAYSRPDHIWFAWWNGAADTNAGTYVPATYWANGQRLHQYQGGHNETYGGVTINIDSNYLDVKGGTPEPPSACQTANLNFTSYPQLDTGSTGDLVKAAQCLLKSRGLYQPEPPTATYDQTTVDAVKAFQTQGGLGADGILGAKTWTALLSAGTTPTVRSGSTGEAVTRLQRALTAALGRTVGIDGDFGPITDQAVRDYQTSRSLGVDGIVGTNTWTALQAGK